jgi:hypothetical protein
MAMKGITTADLNSCFIEGKVRDDTVVLILLARDGSINRMGDGSTSPADRTLYIGMQPEPLFDSLMDAVPEELLQLPGGRAEDRDRTGTDCTLSIMFGLSAGTARTYEVVFGSESGPPVDLQAIYQRVLALTEPWWNDQPGRA